LDDSKYIEMSLQYFEEKKNLFIKILCAKISSVFKPYE
jgi:hypothetical protein